MNSCPQPQAVESFWPLTRHLGAVARSDVHTVNYVVNTI